MSVSDAKVTLATVHGEWSTFMPEMKLRLRSRLPGASAFDESVLGLRLAAEKGTPIASLLAPAMAASWLVNSAVPSPVFQKWLAPPMRQPWQTVFERLFAGWASLNKAARDEVTGALATLVACGGSLGGLTKVLAALSPEPVPLMPDAALAFMLRAVAVPKEPDAQTAPGVGPFAPMMDRIVESSELSAARLESIRSNLGTAFEPRDLVDRLVWFDSVGFRHFRNEQGAWYWVRSPSHEGVVFVAGAAPADYQPGRCVEVPGEDDFSERAASALEEAS